MNILIAVPCMDQVPARFAQSLAMLDKVGNCAVAFNIGSLIYESRNQLARQAINMAADYMFWLDSDMTFEPDTLMRLMADMDKGDIISGLYFRRVPPFSPVLFDKLDISDGCAQWTDFKTVPDAPFEVGGCGFGCVLLPTKILFDVANKFGDWFSPIGRVGEDLSFCWRARQCGYKIICDPAIGLGHVGNHVIDRKFFEAYKGVDHE